jgi:hypothetical protein
MVEGVWNENAATEWYASDRASYQGAILEQYKLYVEMADRISQRRGVANSFFLTLNTAIFTLIGALAAHETRVSAWITLPFIAVLTQCLTWYYIVRSYRRLNSAKYKVIGSLEERLPASPYWRAEWRELGEGKDWRSYWQLSHIESFVPLLFAMIYCVGYIALLIT